MSKFDWWKLKDACLFFLSIPRYPLHPYLFFFHFPLTIVTSRFLPFCIFPIPLTPTASTLPLLTHTWPHAISLAYAFVAKTFTGLDIISLGIRQFLSLSSSNNCILLKKKLSQALHITKHLGLTILNVYLHRLFRLHLYFIVVLLKL